MGLSQGALGDELGLTFQQIQKYEKGTNRVSASKLFEIGNVLGVPTSYFFEEMPGSGKGKKRGGGAQKATAIPLTPAAEFANTREGIELIRAFTKIKNPRVRKRIVSLVSSLTE